MTTIIVLVVVGAIAYRATTPEMRQQAIRALIDGGHRLNDEGREQLEPFRAALRARTPRAYATLALAALHVVLCASLFFGKTDVADPATLIGFGANVGPRTTNGEWWRLLTASFLHVGLLSLLIEVAALVQIGWTLERLVGPLAFSVASVSAMVLAGIARLSASPLGMTIGSAEAILGLYGMLLVVALRSWRSPSPLTVPLVALKRFAPIAVVFAVYVAASGLLWSAAALLAVVTTVVFALAFVGGLTDQRPSPRRVAYGLVCALVTALWLAWPLRGITDVRPELQRLLTVEQHTAGVYQAAARKFYGGVMPAGALAATIDEAIMPELQAADSRIRKVTGVPRDDLSRVDDAREYLRLRSESWRLRAQALRDSAAPLPSGPRGTPQDDVAFRTRANARHRATGLTLGRAESTERAALEKLQRVLPATND